MTDLQRIELRQSQVRERLNEIAGIVELTDEQRAEAASLESEYTDLETRYRAATIAASDAHESRQAGTATDGEGAEIRQLREAARLGAYLEAAGGGGQLPAGPEADLNAALEIRAQTPGAVAVPWAVLDTPGPVEIRQDAVTDTSALGGGTAQRSILQRLFGRDILDALGVRLDSVPPGLARWPLLTGGETPAQVAEGTGHDAAAATFTVQGLTPKRLTGAYVWTVEQAAQVSDIESALRADLAAAVRSDMSRQVLTGDGTAPNVTGILTRLAAPTPAPTVEAGFSDYAASAAQAVDGLHASGEGEVMALWGVDTYKHAAGVVLTSGNGTSALAALRSRARGVMASSYIAAPTNDVQDAIYHAGADTMRGDSIAAVWPALELIRDPYSGAASGTVRLTSITLWDCYTAFRAAAYQRQSFKLA